MASTLKFVQLSDLHQFADPHKRLLNVSPYACFQTVLSSLQLEPQQPDFILLTGDLAQDGDPATYQRIAHAIEQLNIPSFFIPGNHDLSFDQMKQHLASPVFSSDQIIDKGAWRIILLDSQKLNRPEGELSQPQLQFLIDNLKATKEKFCLIALHHHPIKLQMAWLDKSYLNNADQFWQIVSQYPNVKTVICGHIHQAIHKVNQEVDVFSAPSTWIQFAPNTQHFALDSIRKPGYRWYELNDDGTVHSEVVRVEKCDYKPDLDAKGY